MLDISSKVRIACMGDRIESQGDFGTIRYVGTVDGHPGTWFGIDWDDPSRGKHNGSYKGKQYFTASSGISGSFLRPEKVDLGQSIINAITSRYGEKDDEVAAKETQQQLLLIQQNMKAPLLELVGFNKVSDKQSDYNRLMIVNVRWQKVQNIGGAMELRELCPNLRELDLSKNLIISFDTVFDICTQLEHLRMINISENRLTMPQNYTEYKCRNLIEIICASMAMTWETVLQLNHVFPNLEVIVAPNNNVTHLDVGRSDLQMLKHLDIESNPIGDWSEICKLGWLPMLQSLQLDNTGLRSIRFQEEDKTELFKTLTTLVLNNNGITDWESIGELNKLECFSDLRFHQNPILETEDPDTGTQIVIAKIANLKLLNKSDITDLRKGAEYDYLKKYGLEWIEVKDDNERCNAFLERHNRYIELINKYGELEESELKVQSKKIEVSLVKINLHHRDKVVPKKLPPTMTVQKLLVLVQRLFNLNDTPQLLYMSSENMDIEICLEDESKELGIYAMQNDDKIIVIS